MSRKLIELQEMKSLRFLYGESLDLQLVDTLLLFQLFSYLSAPRRMNAIPVAHAFNAKHELYQHFALLAGSKGEEKLARYMSLGNLVQET